MLTSDLHRGWEQAEATKVNCFDFFYQQVLLCEHITSQFYFLEKSMYFP